ncbi:unnamed protein product, partial [Brenthis ino]
MRSGSGASRVESGRRGARRTRHPARTRAAPCVRAGRRDPESSISNSIGMRVFEECRVRKLPPVILARAAPAA